MNPDGFTACEVDLRGPARDNQGRRTANDLPASNEDTQLMTHGRSVLVTLVPFVSCLWLSASVLAALVPNGDFAEDLTLWYRGAWGTGSNRVELAWDGAQGHNASGCARLTSKGAVGVYGVTKWRPEAFVPIVPQSVYRFRAWVKCRGRARAWLQVLLYKTNEADFRERGEYDFVSDSVGAEEWMHVTVVARAPKDARFLRIGVRAAGAGTVWVDDVTIERLRATQGMIELLNLGFEAAQNERLRFWACAAWPPGRSAVQRQQGQAVEGEACLAFRLVGSDARGVALSYRRYARLVLAGARAVEIAVRSSGPRVSLRANYLCRSARRIAIERFALPAGSAWSKVACMLSPRPKAESVQLEIVAEGEGRAWVDAIRPKKGPTDLPNVKGVPVALRSTWSPGQPKLPERFDAPAEPNAAYEPIAIPARRSIAEALDACRRVHPRLMFRKQDVPRMRAWAAGAHREMFHWMMQGASALYPGRGGGGRTIGNAAILFALAYVLTDQEALLSEAKRRMFRICDSYVLEPDLTSKHAVAGLAFGYDWLFDTLSPEERDEIRLRMALHASRWYERAVGRGVNDTWRQNHTQIGTVAYGLAGMALYGDGNPMGGDAASLAWAELARRGFDYILETLPPDGASHEGIMYWAYGTSWMLKYLEAHRRLTGENVFADPWFELIPLFRLYHTMPDMNHNVTFGDATRTMEGKMLPILRWAAGRSNAYGGLSQWLADRLKHARFLRNAEIYEKRAWEFMFYDPRVKPTPPDSLPLWRHFEDLGVAVVRSDWTREATLLAFKSSPSAGHEGALWLEAGKGPVNYGHDHPDANSFQLFSHGKHLAVDVGYTLCKRTHNSNTILVGEHGQPGDGHVWLNSHVPYARAPRIVKFFGSPGLFYVKGAAGGGYVDAASLKRFDRTVVGIKGKWFVIVDDLASHEPRGFRWILNAKQSAEIRPRQVVVRNQDVSLYVTFLAPEHLALNRGIRQVEKFADLHHSHKEVWRLDARTQPVATTRYIVVLTPVRDGSPVPTAKLRGPNTVSVHDGQQRAEVRFTERGVTLAVWRANQLVGVGAVGAEQVVVDGRTYRGQTNWWQTVR